MAKLPIVNVMLRSIDEKKKHATVAMAKSMNSNVIISSNLLPRLMAYPIIFSFNACSTSSGVNTIPPKRPKCSTLTIPFTAKRISSTI